MADTKKSRMGLFSSLRGAKIRFNPRPWSNPQHLKVKPVKVARPVIIEDHDEIKTTMVKKQDKSFVDLHLEVAKKVDALIEQMEQDGRFDNRNEEPSEQDLDLTPDKTIANIDDLLRN